MILNEVQNRQASFKLLESTQEPGVLATFSGTFAEFNKKNLNDRFYSDEVWRHTFKSPEFKRCLEGKIMYGELDHPTDYLDVKIDKTAFCVTKLELDEGSQTVQGELKVLDTPAGKILNTLLRFGSALGVSSRASGELDENNNVIPETYEFITFDIVTNPSNAGAHPVLVESVQGEKPKSLKEALVEAIHTADNSQLSIIRSIANQLDEENEAEIINIIEDRELELDSDENPDRLSIIEEKLDSLLELVKSLIPVEKPEEDLPLEDDGQEEELPKVENKVRAPIRAIKLKENVQRETTTLSVDREYTGSDVDSTERCTHLIQVVRSK